MNIKVSLFNSKTNDLAVVIDLLRASTTITVALNTFDKVIPVNNVEKAFKIKENEEAILAGEQDLKTIEGFDLSNSPDKIRSYNGSTLVLKTTNGTKALETIKKRNEEVKILIGTAINAHAVAKKALILASNEIELIMAGRHEMFTIEDAVGAGFIIEEIIKIANKENIDINLEETAMAVKILVENHDRAKDLIANSWGAKRLIEQGSLHDVEICQKISEIDEVPIYENGEITKA